MLPILHLNGYKIANPTVLSRLPCEDLAAMLRGHGWRAVEVAGSDPFEVHEAYAEALAECLSDIRQIQCDARRGIRSRAAAWPVLVLRTPKGWTGPDKVDGHQVEGTWRSRQVPITDIRSDPHRLAHLETWLQSRAERDGRVRTRSTRSTTVRGRRSHSTS